jgi:hypothetical protein
MESDGTEGRYAFFYNTDSYYIRLRSTYTSEDPRSRRLLMCCPATPVAAAVARPLGTSY